MSVTQNILVSSFAFVLFVASVGIASESAARSSSDTGSQVDVQKGVEYFERHIRPLLVQHCYKCHSEQANKRSGGLVLDSRKGWAEGGDRGAAIVPGDAEGSLVVQAVRHSDPNLQMPPDKRLPDEAILRLEQWVRMGAHDPRTGAVTVKHQNPSDPIVGRSHWAFQPLRPSEPSTRMEAAANGVGDIASTAGANREWPRSPIDRFILNRLDSESLNPVADAEPRDLVRRVYVQLTGLPPTPRELHDFLEDRRPLAWERLVDGLLSSPRFGERWGRHWLDLARYADSNGLDENFLFREAWRYRNWVIDAVASDVPYDRFLLEQLAGDLLPYDSIEQRDRQRIAAGFLVVGPKVLLGNREENQRMEVADEQIETVGKAVLGQTLGCARCHDHKFDPVPTADYYALAGIFTSTQVMERRYMLGEQRVMERLVGLGSDGDKLEETYERYWREIPQVRERRKNAQSVLELLKKGDEPGLQALREKHANAFADGVTGADRTSEQRIAAQQDLISQIDSLLKNPVKIPPRAMIPIDRENPADEKIRLAGQFDRPADLVSRGFLRVVSSDHRVMIPENQSGRLELSQWLTDTESGAGHLTARVLANRLWHHVMGRGIVRTCDNFGRTGEEPTHPELLDYLASELIRSNWSVKTVVRQLVLSHTFALSSQFSADGEAKDPDNRLLWRAHRRRLDPESLRDAILQSAGELDLRQVESTVSYLGDQATGVGKNVRRRTDFQYRSVFLPVIRNDLPELFEAFDFANPHATTGARPQTNVPTQGLFLMNNELVLTASEATARRLLAGDEAGGIATRVDRMFELTVPSVVVNNELRQAVLDFVQRIEEQLSSQGDSASTLRAWTLACHAMFASSRFQFLE